MPTDWKRVAAGYGLDIPEAQLERIAPVLDALVASFRPLAAAIPFETQPATSFHAVEEE